jgi:CubicO group peptidase (beta-lactamase class C family)
MKWFVFLFTLVISIHLPAQTNNSSAGTAQAIKQLESELERLRTILQIPGMSAAMLKDQQVIWSRGFGYADLEQKIKATENTPYVIASLTKPIAATLFFQLLEQGKVGLDDPLKKYYPKDFETERVHVRHILTHTAIFGPGEKPGDKYAYSGSWFGYLGFVIAAGSGQTFRDQLVSQILEPLQMNNSLPGLDVLSVSPSPVDGYAIGTRERYEQVLHSVAKPYTLYGENENIRSPYPSKNIGSAAGLVSTVMDLAKFDVAIDRNQLVKKETQGVAWTQSLRNDGEKIPYGLGWFVQEVNGIKLVWHYGQWPVFSGLILKIPEKNITLILLANSSGLSAPFDGLNKGDVLNSSFALAFLKTFLPASYSKEWEQKTDSSMQDYLQNRIARKRTQVQMDPAALSAYTGKFSLDANRKVTITNVDNHLIIEYPGQTQSQVELFAASDTAFFAKIADVQVSFEKDADGKITGLTLVMGGKKQSALKM